MGPRSPPALSPQEGALTAHSHCLHALQGDNHEGDPGCAGNPGLPGPPGLPGQRGEEVRPGPRPSCWQGPEGAGVSTKWPVVPEGSFIPTKCLWGPPVVPCLLGVLQELLL